MQSSVISVISNILKKYDYIDTHARPHKNLEYLSKLMNLHEDQRFQLHCSPLTHQTIPNSPVYVMLA